LLLADREPIPLEAAGGGYWQARIEGVGEGTRYKFRSGELEFPDLASRQQDGDASGWSIVRKPLAPSDRQGPLRPWHETVLCEVHVGAATPEGTFAALSHRLEHFRDAGYTCLEIMPVHAFPGARNWGYDGTLAFAPASTYGSPEHLRALVDHAHELGLCMVLDVVYNHFGDTFNFARSYVPEWFSDEVKTPWGPGINFENEEVCRFYYENAAMWLSEYDFDGLRFDSVHEMKTDGRDRFLTGLADVAHEVKPHAKLIIENMKNSFRWLERDSHNEPLRYLAQWNDDMHHVLTYLTTRRAGRPDTTIRARIHMRTSRRRLPTASCMTPLKVRTVMVAPMGRRREATARQFHHLRAESRPDWKSWGLQADCRAGIAGTNRLHALRKIPCASDPTLLHGR